MSVHDNCESIPVSDSKTHPGAPKVAEAELVGKFLDDANGTPKTNSPHFFSDGKFSGNLGDLMTAALNNPGEFYNDPYFQAFLKTQNGGQTPTDKSNV
jgi:hypothetical protein